MVGGIAFSRERSLMVGGIAASRGLSIPAVRALVDRAPILATDAASRRRAG
ncbi:hypothetical protein T484DRAFT_1782753 [Baffinella frigidus]|nr:hypothetical protein T484DRAFT_1782753 [Cryptophyta sp. CCMP2293]